MVGGGEGRSTPKRSGDGSPHWCAFAFPIPGRLSGEYPESRTLDPLSGLDIGVGFLCVTELHRLEAHFGFATPCVFEHGDEVGEFLASVVAEIVELMQRRFRKLKDDASEVPAEFGLSVSNVVRMTLTPVTKDRIVALELKVPNTETLAAWPGHAVR